MNKQDWVIVFRRSLVTKGNRRYYFDLTFEEVAIKVVARKYRLIREDALGWHYVSTRQPGYSATIIKRGDTSIGKVKRKATIRSYK